MEQVYCAALECEHFDVAQALFARIESRFGEKSLRVAKLVGMRFEAEGKFDEALEVYSDILEESEAYQVGR